jgi:hypothetical protein
MEVFGCLFWADAWGTGICRYTYEVCLFDEARQKPNKGGTTFSLGYVLLLLPSLFGLSALCV